MTFDLVVLVFSTIGLLRRGPLRSRLQLLVFKQGLVYFIVSFTANLVPVVRHSIPLNVSIVHIHAADMRPLRS